MATAVADVGRSFSIRRRKYINDDIGVLTFWDGYKLVDGKADATQLVRDAVAADPLQVPGSLLERLGREIGGGHGPEGAPVRFELTEKTVDFLGYRALRDLLAKIADPIPLPE